MNKFILDITESFYGTKRFQFIECVEQNKYPISLKFIFDNIKFYFPYLSAQGVPFSIISRKKVINPAGVATLGLACYESFFDTGKQEFKKLFIKQANWLLAQKGGSFHYHFPLNGAKPPWISCLAQGLGISVLLRAFWLQKDESYLSHAIKASKLLFFDNQTSPIISTQKCGKFLEEVPSRNPSHILNGFLSALIGLSELLVVHNTTHDLQNLAFWLQTVESNLYKYHGTLRWSLYEKNILGKNFSTTGYHSLHISQLKALNKKFPNSLILKTINQWDNGLKCFSSRIHALIRKSFFRLKN